MVLGQGQAAAACLPPPDPLVHRTCQTPRRFSADTCAQAQKIQRGQTPPVSLLKGVQGERMEREEKSAQKGPQEAETRRSAA